MRRLGILFTVLSIILPSCALAQAIPGINDPMTLTTTPTLPAPGETTSIEANSYSFDIDTANVTWTANGKVITEGVGDKTITFEAGALGSSAKITATAATADGQNFSESTIIAPSQIALIWEGNTYTPPFYKGKALRSWGASYTVVAIPQVVVNGAEVPASSLVYTWSKNNSVDSGISGYGKDVYEGDGSVSYTRGGDTIGVTVATSDGTQVGQASIVVPVTQTQMFMYQESPIYGVLYNQAVGGATLNGDSITLRTEPFFFSDLQNIISSLVWTMNGDSVPAFAGNPSITLARENKSAGTAVISVSLQSSLVLLQAAQKSVTIDINAQP